MSEIAYIPVPVWNGSRWIPRDFSGSNDELPWPAGVNPEQLPMPPVMLGQSVRFKWGYKTLEGEVREIKLKGGTLRTDPYDGLLEDYRNRYRTLGDAIKLYYSEDSMRITIYTNGHGRWVSRNDLIGV